jgi:hypothetical protein
MIKAAIYAMLAMSAQAGLFVHPDLHLLQKAKNIESQVK